MARIDIMAPLLEVENFPAQMYRSWTKTEKYIVKCRHTWVIDDYFDRLASAKVGIELSSKEFGVPVILQNGEPCELVFGIKLFLKGEPGRDESDHLAIYLHSYQDRVLRINYNFGIQRSDGTLWGRTVKNDYSKFSAAVPVWGFKTMFSKTRLNEEQNKLLPDGKLTIVCAMKIHVYDRESGGNIPTANEFDMESTPSLLDDLSAMTAFSLCPDNFTDISFICENKTFWCHKFILAARSDVFTAMFSHPGTREAITQKVEITDIEPNTFELLLKFIYTDYIDDDTMRTFAVDLLKAADKYNVRRLKILCEKNHLRKP